MEGTCIPCVAELNSQTLYWVDTFCKYTSEVSELFANGSGFTAAKEVLKKILEAQKVRESGLNDILVQSILTIVRQRTSHEIYDNTTKEKMENSILNTKTFDKKSIKAIEEDVQILENRIEAHQKILGKVIEGQKTYWKTHSSVTKYNLMLTTAEKAREHLKDEIKKSELKSRDKSIRGLTKDLKDRQERADSAAISYYNLLSREEECRTKVSEVAKKIQSFVYDNISKRMTAAMNLLKSVLKKWVSSDKLENVLTKINSVDIDAIINNIFKGASKTYCFPVPREYHAQSGFVTLLPTGKVSGLEKREIKVEVPEINDEDEYMYSNFYTKPKQQNSISGFLKASSGMKIKVKVHLNEVGFGWTRKFKWTPKKWGFFEGDEPSKV